MRFREGCALRTVGDDCFRCSGLEEVEVPRAVTALGRGAFQECRGLREVVFQEGSRLEKIPYGCFAKTGVRRLVIPSGVTAIGARAFYMCKALEAVELPGSVRRIEGHVFYGC